MISYGISEDKIILIPLPVNRSIFKEKSESYKLNQRIFHKLPKDEIIIGSFQKDGVGWGAGNVPKLIKGPDIFCDVVESLNKKFDIHIILTGPSRGYVINRLKKMNVTYSHFFEDNPENINKYYQIIDLYLITSRQEGGPKSLLESFASGVPVVSTKVGMAIDCIIDGENGFLTEVDDVLDLSNKASYIISNKNLKNKFIKNNLKIADRLNEVNVGNKYFEKLYKDYI